MKTWQEDVEAQYALAPYKHVMIMPKWLYDALLRDLPVSSKDELSKEVGVELLLDPCMPYGWALYFDEHGDMKWMRLQGAKEAMERERAQAT